MRNAKTDHINDKPLIPFAFTKEQTAGAPSSGPVRLPRITKHSAEDIIRMNLILDVDSRVTLKNDAMMLPWGISPDAAGILVYSRLIFDATLQLSARLNLAYRLLCLPLSERWFRPGAADHPMTPDERARLQTHPRRRIQQIHKKKTTASRLQITEHFLSFSKFMDPTIVHDYPNPSVVKPRFELLRRCAEMLRLSLIE